MSKSTQKTFCVLMTGPDVQMDQRGDSYEPANALPARCLHCSFPEIDFIPNPYVLTKGVSSPAETSPAQVGNFLVRERVKRILEIATPGACSFYPTVEKRNKETTPWWLVVPQQMKAIPVLPPVPPFCSQCHEPKKWSCAMGKVWDQMKTFDSKGVDIFKSIEWFSHATAEDQVNEANRVRTGNGLPALAWPHRHVAAPAHEQRWTRLMLQRDLYFSVRLEQLLNRAKVKGQLVRMGSFKDAGTTPEDEIWIEQKLGLLAECGLAEARVEINAKGEKSGDKWFAQFLKKNAKKQKKPVDFVAMEAKWKVALPESYKEFIYKIGPMAFENVMEMEGFTASVLAPKNLDFKDYRRGCMTELDEEHSQIDGVMFAETEHGDAFVFDVSAKSGEYPVYWHDHEQNTLEPFAPNFSECIKRFSEGN